MKKEDKDIVAELLGERTVEPWLKQTLDGTIAGSLVSQVEVAGIIARLWSPTNAAAARAAIYRLRAGTNPRAKALTWFRSLSKEAKESVERAAVNAADGLDEMLAALERKLSESTDNRTLALAWLHRRDDLEGVLLLLRGAGAGEHLANALRRVDTEAGSRNSMWSLVRPFDDDARLAAVSWQEPESWWGALSFGVSGLGR